MSNESASRTTAAVIDHLVTREPSAAALTLNDFTADLLEYEGILVRVELKRGMTAKRAIKSLYSATFHSRLGATACVRQLAARLAECLNIDMLTYAVLNRGGERAHASVTIAALRRTTQPVQGE